MKPRFDDRDARIVAERCAKWDEKQGPRVGDFVQLKDGTLRRFTHDWGADIQTTKAKCTDESFYLGLGYMDFSGTLDSAIPKAKLERLPFARKGTCWFFHHGEVQAHNGVHTEVNCRVYMEV